MFYFRKKLENFQFKHLYKYNFQFQIRLKTFFLDYDVLNNVFLTHLLHYLLIFFEDGCLCFLKSQLI
ncbi:hypothetical protein BpHYR1_010331 [Brachionus plicatilis]|uniref:Uncharacterized protein n=1 Tax=Brachionus plicatilis TaxID=10195 RepID=A0A3M7T8Q8_BRAPC|nr:hypothetical protein BpHYR1_010331 [Brachionus plicatilis]